MRRHDLSVRCTKCGGQTVRSIGDHAYLESGMDHVVLDDVVTRACGDCGASSVEITAIGQLHRAMAGAIVRRPARLVPSEVRFLRDHLELTNRRFALLMGVTEHQASRWTGTDPMGLPAEHLLRMLATIGPMLLPDDERPQGPDQSRINEAGSSSADDVLHSLRRTLVTLASIDDGCAALRIKARRGRSGWSATWFRIQPASASQE